MAKAKVDQTACIGCGVCTAIAASIFAFGEGNLVEAVVDVIPTDTLSAVEEAAASCPVQAISVE